MEFVGLYKGKYGWSIVFYGVILVLFFRVDLLVFVSNWGVGVGLGFSFYIMFLVRMNIFFVVYF